jgi:23S rRNA pseudouridine1911/1915/1917 synthase
VSGEVKDSLSFVVAASEAGERLDKLVVARAKIGRRRAAELFSAGKVSVNGRRANKGDAAAVGDEIGVELAIDDRPQPEPDAPLVVRYETAEVVIAYKSAGQPTAPLRGEPGTLAGALLGRYPEMADLGHSPREPGILHRLDTQTSGLVIAARRLEAWNALHHALSRGEMTKRYLAIVEGAELSDRGVIDTPLAPDRKNPKRVLTGDYALGRRGKSGARDAVSRYRVVSRHGRWALVELEVSRAYRHQVRAHLAAIGHPIAGDAVYGGPAAPELGDRHALHASYVAWAGDAIVTGFAVEEPLPADMGSLIA